MALPISLSPFGMSAAVNYTDFDFHTYARQSSTMSYGNANTGIQEDDLPRLMATRFGVDPNTHPFFKVYQTEVESAADGSLSVRRDQKNKGRLIIDDFQRHGLLDIFELVQERWDRYRRPAIIGVTMLNRLGRSDWVLPLLSTYGNQTEGNLWIYVAGTGAMLNPTNPTDQNTFTAEFSFSGKGENRTKHLAVVSARRHIGTQQGKATRSLGERTFGYEKVFVDYAGNRLTDEEAIDWLQKRSKQPPKALVRVDDYAPIVKRMFDLLTISNFRPARIASILNAEFGDNPVTQRPWTANVIRRILDNPIYRGQRVTDRTRALNMGNKKRRRRSRPDELVISPVDESLRFVSDEQWALAQELLVTYNTDQDSAVGKQQAARKQRGRPTNVDLLFHRGTLLRCGLCGAHIHVRAVRTRGNLIHYYRCGYRTNTFAQPRCQSHKALVIDTAVHETLRSLFANIEQYVGEAKAEVQKLRAEQSMNLIDKRLAVLQADLKKLDSALLLTRLDLQSGKTTEKDYERLKRVVDEKAEEVARLEERRISNVTNVQLKARERRLAQLQGVQAFDKAPLPERQALLHDMLENVWLWPDGEFNLQWKGQEEEDVVARSGRPLRIAQHWPHIDFHALSAQTVRLIQENGIPLMLVDSGSGSGSIRRTLSDIAKGKHDSARQTGAILRTYMRTREVYFNRPKADKDIRPLIDEDIANGVPVAHIAKKLGVSRFMLLRYLKNAPNKWLTMREFTLGAVKAYGLNYDDYFKLPDWAFDHPMLDEMASWILGVSSEDESGESEGTSQSYLSRKALGLVKDSTNPDAVCAEAEISEKLSRPCTGSFSYASRNARFQGHLEDFERFVIPLLYLSEVAA
jgi:hypothetical protein